MKKYFKISLLLLISLFLLLGCFGNEEIENVLIGTWKYMNYNTGDWEKITFNEDLTYRLENYNGTTYQTAVTTGAYTYDEDRFTYERRGAVDISFNYSISGNNLYILGRAYIRQ